MAIGGGEDRLRLAYLGAQADIAPGDVFLTTGTEGRFPRGLVVGVVEEVQPQGGYEEASGGLGMTAELRPRASWRELHSVFLLARPRVERPPTPN